MKRPIPMREVFLDFDPVFPDWPEDRYPDEVDERRRHHPPDAPGPSRPCPHPEHGIVPGRRQRPAQRKEWAPCGTTI